ncbi:hypothetical protein ACFQ0B_80255 [Nonomuraea thailandensis]
MNAEAASSVAKVTDPVPMIELLAPGGIGRVYTLSAAEAATAVSLHKFTHERGQASYGRTTAFTGSQPVYRLRTGSSYLLTASAWERDGLVAGGRFVYEGIAGHLAQQRTAGTQRLMRFSKRGEWRVALREPQPGVARRRVPRRQVARLGTSGMDSRWSHLFRHVQSESPPTSSTPRSRPSDATATGGAASATSRRRPGRTAEHPGVEGDFSHLRPEIGFYDDYRPETVEKHIEQATGAGLDFFQFYWYWDTAHQRSPSGSRHHWPPSPRPYRHRLRAHRVRPSVGRPADPQE